MSEPCALCRGPVNPHDIGTWKQVIGWVGGPRKDAMTLREDTGYYAHDSCVQKAKGGQSADQPSLDEAENPMKVFKPMALGSAKFVEFDKLMAEDAEPVASDRKTLDELFRGE